MGRGTTPSEDLASSAEPACIACIQAIDLDSVESLIPVSAQVERTRSVAYELNLILLDKAMSRHLIPSEDSPIEIPCS